VTGNVTDCPAARNGENWNERSWPNAEALRRPHSRRYQGHTEIKRALTRGIPIYECLIPRIPRRPWERNRVAHIGEARDIR
jgi:hypothetical protein